MRLPALLRRPTAPRHVAARGRSWEAMAATVARGRADFAPDLAMGASVLCPTCGRAAPVDHLTDLADAVLKRKESR